MNNKNFICNNVYRIYEINHGTVNEIAFILGEKSKEEYLESCNKWNKDKDIFYFAEKIKIEK